MPKLYTGSIGFAIECETKLVPATLATATVVAMAVKKPSGTSVSWPSIVVPNTSRIRYVTTGLDIDLAGDYQVQPVLTLPGGTQVRGDTIALPVFAHFE